VSASKIVEGLYVGSAPPPGDYHDLFDVIVLVSDEYQPEEKAFRGVMRVRRFPFDDSRDPTNHDLQTAWTAAEAVARDLRRWRLVLVSCRIGRNRSALVAALAIYLLTGVSGEEAMQMVREARVDDTGTRALSNPAFRDLLVALPAT